MSAVTGSADDPPPSDDRSTDTGVPDERVLLVEPAGPLRERFAQALRSEGFLTEAVGVAEIALELVRSWCSWISPFSQMAACKLASKSAN